jgi:hypothetical protein
MQSTLLGVEQAHSVRQPRALQQQVAHHKNICALALVGVHFDQGFTVVTRVHLVAACTNEMLSWERMTGNTGRARCKNRPRLWML